jgi:hypothetical protein
MPDIEKLREAAERLGVNTTWNRDPGGPYWPIQEMVVRQSSAVAGASKHQEPGYAAFIHGLKMRADFMGDHMVGVEDKKMGIERYHSLKYNSKNGHYYRQYYRHVGDEMQKTMSIKPNLEPDSLTIQPPPGIAPSTSANDAPDKPHNPFDTKNWGV